MTWLDGKLAAFEYETRRDSDINAHAPALFKAVWDQVFAIVQEANGKGFELRTNGNSERRSLEHCAGPTYRPVGMRPEIITVSLSQDRHALEVSGLKAGTLTFQIDTCPDNIVCLHFAGTQKTPEECAHIILGRFLFKT
jgi:hypothetical protein